MFEHLFEQVLVEGDLDPILHQGTDRGRRLQDRAKEHDVRRYDDPVEVRKGADEDPEQFLWRGRLWQVREVVAHWVGDRAWWARRPAAPEGDLDGVAQGGVASGGVAVDTDLLREREVWRVAAARGRVAALSSPEHDPGFGVFDLVFSWSEGSWQLVRRWTEGLR